MGIVTPSGLGATRNNIVEVQRAVRGKMLCFDMFIAGTALLDGDSAAAIGAQTMLLDNTGMTNGILEIVMPHEVRVFLSLVRALPFLQHREGSLFNLSHDVFPACESVTKPWPVQCDLQVTGRPALRKEYEPHQARP